MCAVHGRLQRVNILEEFGAAELARVRVTKGTGVIPSEQLLLEDPPAAHPTRCGCRRSRYSACVSAGDPSRLQQTEARPPRVEAAVDMEDTIAAVGVRTRTLGIQDLVVLVEVTRVEQLDMLVPKLAPGIDVPADVVQIAQFPAEGNVGIVGETSLAEDADTVLVGSSLASEAERQDAHVTLPWPRAALISASCSSLRFSKSTSPRPRRVGWSSLTGGRLKGGFLEHYRHGVYIKMCLLSVL